MQRSGGARFFPFLITVIIIVLVIVALISIGRMLFGGTPSTDNEATPGVSELLTIDADHSVQMTVRGPIVAEEEFQSYTISVSPSSRKLVIYDGYLDTVGKREKLSNNTQAYEQFVYALDKANMMVGTEPDDKEANDLRGICATGYVFEYSVLTNDEPVKHLWTSTCSGSQGTLKASTLQLNNLFFEQIPNSQKIVPFTGATTSFRL